MGLIEGFIADLTPPFLVTVCPRPKGWGVVIYDIREVCPSNPKGIAATHDEPTLNEAKQWDSLWMLDGGGIEATSDDVPPDLPWESLVCGES